MRQHTRVPFVILVLIVLNSSLHAVSPYQPVNPDPVLESWRWTHYPELSGLGLRCMAEDREGRMWFGVEDGVRVYDGLKWTGYTEADVMLPGRTEALCAARDGSVYAASPTGISRFRDGKWERVFQTEDTIPLWFRDVMEASDGSIWAASFYGVVRIRNDEAILYSSSDCEPAIRMLAPDVRFVPVPADATPSAVWDRGEGIGVWWERPASARPNRPFVITLLLPGGPADAAGLRIGDRIMTVDGDSTRDLRIPAGTTAALTVERPGVVQPLHLAVTGRKLQETLHVFGMWDVYEDRDANIWFGLWGSSGERELAGVIRHDPRAASPEGPDSWRLFAAKDGLDIAWAPRILQTRDGTIWVVGARGADAVNRFDGRQWTTLRLYDLGGNNHNPSILETRDGTVWVGGAGGPEASLHAYRDGVWTVYRRPDVPVPSTFTEALMQASDGALWLAGRGQEALRLDYATPRWTSYEGLSFHCQTRDGSYWFLSSDTTVVRNDGSSWVQYDPSDGLMDGPRLLYEAQDGVLYATGTHVGESAVSSFDGRSWGRAILPGPQASGSGPGSRGTGGFQQSDGSLWFGGVSRFDGRSWTRDPYSDPYQSIYGMAETPDGRLWFGSYSSLRFYDGEAWTRITDPGELSRGIKDLCTDAHGSLWVGTSSYGVFQLQDGAWTHYDVTRGLASNNVESIFPSTDGGVWAATDNGTSRFDGRSWQTHALSPLLPPPMVHGVVQSPDGVLWVHVLGPPEPGWDRGKRVLIRYVPDPNPPETELRTYAETVSQPGNTTLAWKGTDRWRDTPDDEIQFSWRLDGREWSVFSRETNRIFELLPSGTHTFEVKARDRDFNEDPTPASVTFTVLPPVWQEPWFIGLMVVLLGGIGFQTGRVVRRDKRLRESNAALSDANKELFGVNRELQESNRELQRDRAVEHIRAHVQSMDQASDFDRVLSLLSEDMKAVGLAFDTCGIDVLDEPVDEPTMAYFEQHGFRYTTYAIDPDGTVDSDSYHVPAPFPPVNLEMIERFIAGQAWRARTEQNAIVEVPIAGYGRLRLTASDRQEFSQDDIEALEDFAAAIALGYARYLDIREIQEQTQRKSAFLASMSHDLRTPMNAIKGFTSMVLRRIGDTIPERHRDNLGKVIQASDVLLEMINDLMDLSKIEAGRMDVNTEPFDVKALVATCCATVSPLVAEKPDVKLDYEVADDIGQANTDQARLRRMVINLLSNATKFTDAGSVSVNAAREGDQLVISVADTGKGIPADEIDTIFDEYRQVVGSDTEGKGTGLGLSITRRFAELLGGTIGVESEEGKGSIFTVKIPATYEEREAL